MKTATERFKSLGFTETVFEDYVDYDADDDSLTVSFNLVTKTYSVVDYRQSKSVEIFFNPALHMAIHVKMIELGWIQTVKHGTGE